MKQCLNCSALSEDDAERCVDCHVPLDNYRQVQGGSAGPVIRHPVIRRSDSATGFTWLGLTLIGIGLLTVFYGLFSSGAPSGSETLNLGLLNDKTNLTIAGGFSVTSGSIFLGVSAVIAKLSRLGSWTHGSKKE